MKHKVPSLKRIAGKFRGAVEEQERRYAKTEPKATVRAAVRDVRKRFARFKKKEAKLIARSIVYDAYQLMAAKQKGDLKGFKIVFIGKAMRPFFEGLSQLNNASRQGPGGGIFKRGEINYWIIPRQGALGRGTSTYDVGESIADLKRLRILMPSTKKLLFVDYFTGGPAEVGEIGSGGQVSSNHSGIARFLERDLAAELEKAGIECRTNRELGIAGQGSYAAENAKHLQAEPLFSHGREGAVERNKMSRLMYLVLQREIKIAANKVASQGKRGWLPTEKRVFRVLFRPAEEFPNMHKRSPKRTRKPAEDLR